MIFLAVAHHSAHFLVSPPPLAQLIPAVTADAVHSTSRPQNESDERQLIDRLRRGEREALEEMIAANRDRVTRLVSRLSGWTNETDDLVQEVFVLALQGIGRFRGGSRISTWLTRIAINVCRSHHRTRLLRKSFWKRWMSQAIEPAAADASESIEQQERVRQVTASVRKLKSKYREVVVLHYLEGMAAEDIGQVLGVSRNTVEVRLHRARQMLHEMLKSMMES